MSSREELMRRLTLSGRAGFLLLWGGGLFSAFGTQLADFTIGIWLFGDSSSAAQYSFFMFINIVPAAMVSVISGPIIDRFDRRVVFIISDAIAAVLAVALYLLAQSNSLLPWHVYVITGARTLLLAFQLPALHALTVMLVGDDQLNRANSLSQLSDVLVLVAAPIAGGLLFAVIGVAGAVLIDLVTFGFALIGGGLLFLTEIREQPPVEEDGNILAQIATGWRYLGSRAGLMALLMFYGLVTLMRAVLVALYVPLVLSFAGPRTLGIMAGIGVVGGIVGTVILMIWDGPDRRIGLVLATAGAMGLTMILGGLRPSIALVTAVGFLFWIGYAMNYSLQLAIWQTTVPDRMLGRVLSIRQMFDWIALSIGMLFAGILADRVFEPFMTTGETAGFLGQLFTTGTGRGIGLLISVAGLMMLLATAVAVTYKPLRYVEEETTITAV